MVRIKRFSIFVASFFFIILGILLFWAFYKRYLKWDFNELGRYYDAESQLVYTDSAFIWGILAVPFLFVGIVLLIRSIKRKKRENINWMNYSH